jgi:hypothetical protein
MKAIFRAIGIVVLCAVAPSLAGAESPREGETLSQQELAALEQFLTLSDEQLDRIQAAVARVRSMPLEERQAYAQEIIRLRSLPQEERAQIRQGWGWQTPEDREDWRTMMQKLSPKERQELHESMGELPPGERVQFRVKVLEEWRKQQ